MATFRIQIQFRADPDLLLTVQLTLLYKETYVKLIEVNLSGLAHCSLYILKSQFCHSDY